MISFPSESVALFIFTVARSVAITIQTLAAPMCWPGQTLRGGMRVRETLPTTDSEVAVHLNGVGLTIRGQEKKRFRVKEMITVFRTRIGQSGTAPLGLPQLSRRNDRD